MNLLQQTNSHLVEVEEMVNEPHSSVLGYPRCSSDELESRVRELKTHHVKGVLFEGKGVIGKLNILGKGCVSVVVKAIYDHEIIALKIRRTDANRESMENEARLLELANGIGIGPKLIKRSRNFLLMEYIDGKNMFSFLEEENNATKLLHVVSEVLEQCCGLDSIGLDHGQLSDMREHVIVSDKITIIDFESASTNRKVSNVTAAAQYLFIGGPMKDKIRELLKINSTDAIIQLLRAYKKDASKENFERLKQILNL